MILVFLGCGEITDETYHHLRPEERRRLSAEYTQLARRTERGSPEYMKLLEKAVRINPKNDQAYYELALPYLYSGQYEQWNEYMARAIRYNPQAWQATRGYQKLFCLRDYGGALFDFDATDSLTLNQTDYTQNMSVDYLRGLCYLGLGNLPKAEEYFNIYIKKETEDTGEEFVDETAYMYLGIIRFRQGQYEASVEEFERALRFEDGLADIHYHLARSYAAMNEYEKAFIEIVKAENSYDRGQYVRTYMCSRPGQLYKGIIEKFKKTLPETNT